MSKELERRGLPVALVSAIRVIPLGAGAIRVVKGVRVEHVCGDPGLSDAADKKLRRRIVTTALRALQTAVAGPTLFDPGEAP
jgi:glycine/betaine/sarcosine/D-proline reductase family selenoprotein B